MDLKSTDAGVCAARRRPSRMMGLRERLVCLSPPSVALAGATKVYSVIPAHSIVFTLSRFSYGVPTNCADAQIRWGVRIGLPVDLLRYVPQLSFVS